MATVRTPSPMWGTTRLSVHRSLVGSEPREVNSLMNRLRQRHDASVPPLALHAHKRPNDWRSGLPTLTGGRVTLRELQPDDAAPLFAAMANREVGQFLSPPPKIGRAAGRERGE